MTAEHVLVITPDSDGPDDNEPYYSYAVECPGVTDDCRAWKGCEVCPREMTDEQDDDLWDDGEAHGEEHRKIQGEWMVPTASCFVAGFDELYESARYLDLPAGRWPVAFTVEDDGELLILEPVK